jgi:hypothetical protein
MTLRLSVLFALAAGLFCTRAGFAADASDPVQTELDAASETYEKSVAAVDASFRKALDRQYNALLDKGDLDNARRVEAAIGSFEKDGTVDTANVAELVRAARDRDAARSRAARSMVDAFDRAVRTYTKQRKLDAATGVKRERDQFVARSGDGGAAAGASNIPAGAVLYLSFEQNTIRQKECQTFVHDLSPAKNNGTFRGAKLIRDGRVGQAVSFDGKASIDCGNAKSLQFTEAFTLATFVRRVDPHTFGQLMSKEDWHAGGSRDMVLRFEHSRPNLTVDQNGWRFLSADFVMKPAVWHHVAGTYDGKRTRVYVDGKERASQEVGGPVRASPYPLLLGQDTFDHARTLKGDLDEVMVFNRALDAAEVEQLAKRKS